MKKEIRTVIFNASWRIEAYSFKGVVQPFPKHFHEHYVIGLVEEGKRFLSCRNRNYAIGPGSVILFNPGDSHACVQADDRALDYRGMNISQEVMLDLMERITGKRRPPGFSPNVIYDEKVISCLRPLHEMMMNGHGNIATELLLLLSRLILNHGQLLESGMPECREAVKKVCKFMERHFAERLHLDQVARQAGLSTSTLLRVFAESKGITPYRYLESIRISEARKLLLNGVSLPDAAIMTGFSDQSHFTNYFARFTGFTPGRYRQIYWKREGQEIT